MQSFELQQTCLIDHEIEVKRKNELWYLCECASEHEHGRFFMILRLIDAICSVSFNFIYAYYDSLL